MSALKAGFEIYHVDIELQRSLRDVHDHAIRIVDRADSYRALLQNALTVHATLVAQRQNDETRHLTEASLAQSEEVNAFPHGPRSCSRPHWSAPSTA
jgi:magnesium transporter